MAADADEDKTVPPFSTATLPLHTVLTAYLDKEKPLSEPRWVKTGDVHDWLKSMFGRMFWVSGDAAAEGWEKKIEVMDADPVSPPFNNLVIRSDDLNSFSHLPFGLFWKHGPSIPVSVSKLNVNDSYAHTWQRRIIFLKFFFV